MPTDEPRFALVAHQMITDPAPVVPHLGYDPLTREGELYADKPPLFFWLISLFSLPFGRVTELSARLPSLVAAVAAVLLTRRLGTMLANERIGFLAALMLAATNQFFLRSAWCSIDMVLTALALGATDCWLRAARCAGRGESMKLAAMGGCLAAAATLSKGPVGAIFPVTFLLADRLAAALPSAWRLDGARIRLIGTAGAAYLLPIVLWIGAIAAIAGHEYVMEILFRQNVMRYVDPWNNLAPWHYYFYRLPIGLAPWLLLLPGALLAARGLPRQRSIPLRGLLIALVSLFLFFSLTTGKRGVYLLPLYPAFAILLAVAWDRTDSRFHRAIGVLHLGTMLFAGLAALVVLPRLAARRYPDLTAEAWILASVMAAGMIVATILFARGDRTASLIAQASTIALLVFTASLLLVPFVNARSGLRPFGGQLAALAAPTDRLVVDQEGFEQILFYSGLRGARRNFDRTRVLVEDESVLMVPREGGGTPPGAKRTVVSDRAIAGRDFPPVRYPRGDRVLFVVKEHRSASLRAGLSPASRVLLEAKVAGDPYVVIASRD